MIQRVQDMEFELKYLREIEKAATDLLCGKYDDDYAKRDAQRKDRNIRLVQCLDSYEHRQYANMVTVSK